MNRSLLPVVFGTVMTWCLLVGQASGLPSERHYEQVSPVYKGGFGATRIEAVAPTGEAVGFYSPGNFVEAPSGPILGPAYLARHGTSGWSSVSLVPPASMIAEKIKFDLSLSLDTMFMMGDPGPNGRNAFNETELLTHFVNEPDIETTWRSVGLVKSLGNGQTAPQYEGTSKDFCHVAILGTANEQFVSEALGVGDKELYQVEGNCDESGQSVLLVALNNQDKMISRVCDSRLGGDGYSSTAPNQFNAVSADGLDVFFTVCTTPDPAAHSGSDIAHQVFVRLGGLRTLEISRPLAPECEARGISGEVPCRGAEARASADFQGASEDGSRVYFTASLGLGQSSLVPGVGDSSTNLYVARIGCPTVNPTCSVSERVVTSLEDASRDPNSGQGAAVLGVTRVAPDGSRAYFVADGDLLEPLRQQTLEAEGRPVPRDGAANLYVYDDKSEAVTFIGELCSGSLASGDVEDRHCPGPDSDQALWNLTAQETQAQTSGENGRFLVFTTNAQLVANDTNSASDVYRYDAVTGTLQRVSVGEGGFDDNGNRTILGPSGEVLGATILPGRYDGPLIDEHGLGVRAVSENGSRVVFSSAEPLSPMAANGLENAYEWHEGPGGGNVALISSGEGSQPVNDVTISPDGTGVFFVTVNGLVSQDTDGLPDIYDARLGEAPSEAAAAPRHSCEADACQGPLTNPAPLLVPGSVTQTPGGNFAPTRQVSVGGHKRVKAKKKPKKTKRMEHSKRSKKRQHRQAHLSGNVVAGRGQ